MAFFFLVLYVVLLLLRPQDWFEPLQGFRLIDLTAIGAVIATFITRSSKESSFATLRDDTYSRLLWGMFAAVILSELTKFRLAYALEAFQDFGKLCVLFFLSMLLVDRPGRTRVMLWVIASCAGILIFHTMLQVQRGYGFGDIEPYTTEALSGRVLSFQEILATEFRVRGSGIFKDPNDFAMLYVMATPFVVALFQAPGSALLRLLPLTLIPGFLYVLYYTKSRGGLAGFAAMVLAYMWMTGRRSFFRLVISVALVALAVALGPARATQTVYEGSAGGRVVAWGIGNGFLKENPLFGIGYNRWIDYERLTAHSSFVICYAELGLTGYFFWFTLIFVIIRSLLRITRLPRHLDPLAIRLAGGLFAGLVGYMVCAFFLTRTYNPVLYFLLGLGVGLIRHVQRNTQLPSQLLAVTRRDLVLGGALAAASIPGLWVLIKLYWAIGGSGT